MIVLIELVENWLYGFKCSAGDYVSFKQVGVFAGLINTYVGCVCNYFAGMHSLNTVERCVYVCVYY